MTKNNEFINIIKRYGHLPISERLLNLLSKHTNEEVLRIMEMITHYRDEGRRGKSEGYTYPEILGGMYEAMESNAMAPEMISCRKGCSHCCHIQVTITAEEAKLITLWCEENNVPVDYEHMKKQVGLTEHNHAQSPHSACAFLKDNVCTVYAVRPFNCRNYQVASPPDLCDAKKHPKTIVKVFVDVRREIFHSAFLAVTNVNTSDQGAMAEIFLKQKS